MKIFFPFTAIVGLEDAKLALLVNAVNPLIGGVVLAGDKGTGKSTLVRAFAQILPEQAVAENCPFNCNPFNPLEMCDHHYMMWSRGEKINYKFKRIRIIDLPLNATPDRVVGSIDVEETIRSGRVIFKPGLLAEANRNILYIDEVNLLEDYIADLILDAAASGWNIIEREGISFRHPARFVLIGSMNPEEGMLRPQILDRFGLYIPIEASKDPDERAEIVERVEEFSIDPIAFYKKWEIYERELKEKIMRAREIISKVKIDRDLLKFVTSSVVKMGIKTHRAEIVTIRTAKAIAALDGRDKVDIDDVVKAMKMSLRHRIKSKPFDESEKRFDEIIKEIIGEKFERKNYEIKRENNEKNYSEKSDRMLITSGDDRSVRIERLLKEVSENPNINNINIDRDIFASLRLEKMFSERDSRETRSISIASLKGVPIDAIPPLKTPYVDIDLPTTLRVSLTHNPKIPIIIRPEHIRVRVRRKRAPTNHIILFDASGSMLHNKKIETAKYILKKLIKDSYVKRTYVSLIIFRGLSSYVIAEPTRDLEKIYRSLDEIPMGGSTPFTSALLKALEYSKIFKKRFKGSKVVLHIISDGRANIFLTNDPVNEILNIAREFKMLNTEVISYHVSMKRQNVSTPNYLRLFTEAVEGIYNLIQTS